MTGILAGIKVVEFAQNAAVPYCGRLLAGMGADVVKVEPPEGDAMRSLAQLAPNEGKAYAVINPGKRAITLDLGAGDAVTVVRALCAWADVVLVGFKQSDLARYGIDDVSARAINPRLIHLTHTPFGPEGPDADVGGYDVLVQGRSGAGYIMNRTEKGVPISTRPAVNDFGTGIASALGVVAALRHRDLTGEGQRVDASLLGTALALATPLVNFFETIDLEPLSQLDEDLQLLRAAGVSFEEQREVYEQRVIPGAGAFRLYFRHYATADGLISIAGLSPGLVRRFHEITGLALPDRSDPYGADFNAVVEAADALFRTKTSAEWMATLREAGYPCAPYNTPFEAVRDEQIRANDFIIDLEHPTFGSYSASGEPIRFSAAPAERVGPSPSLGQHTREVLAEIGLDATAIDQLVTDGVVTAPS
jgi:crotonobetainyl-CoA:carnitine CoA-transferase CaiB-like acyl-CoA transferase